MPAYPHTDRKNKKEIFFYEFQYKGDKYKKSGFKRKKDAEAAEDELKYKLRNGLLLDEIEDDFNTHIQSWLDRRTNIGDNTVSTYQQYITNYFIPFFKKKKLKSIKPIEVQRFLDELRNRGLSLSVQEKAYNIINKVFRDSVKLKLIGENPVSGVEKPKVRKRNKVEIFNVDDLTTFLEFSRMYTRYFFAFYLAVHTGLRRGEILALKWGNVDWQNKRLLINSSVVKAARNTDRYIKEGTKNNENRTIAISDMLIKELRLHKNKQDEEKSARGYQNNNLVICTNIGTHVYPDALTRAFRKTLKASGLKNDIHMHDLRHTHASLLLTAGIGMKVVSERLGHSSIKITMDTYSHLLPNSEQEAADKFADLFRKVEVSPPEIPRSENTTEIEEYR